MLCAGVPAFFGLGLEDGHLTTFWLLLKMAGGPMTKAARPIRTRQADARCPSRRMSQRRSAVVVMSTSGIFVRTPNGPGRLDVGSKASACGDPT